MLFLFKSKGDETPCGGMDWIVLGANSLGLAVVMAATLHANSPVQAVVAEAPAAIELASLE